MSETQSIEVQYRDGRPDELITGTDLAARWEEISEQAGIQFAAWRKPKTSGDGTRVAGIFGATRQEAASQAERDQHARQDRTAAAIKQMEDARGADWNGYQDSYGWKPAQ